MEVRSTAFGKESTGGRFNRSDKNSTLQIEGRRGIRSWETVRAIEARLTERMDSLSDQVMKMPDAIVERMPEIHPAEPTKIGAPLREEPQNQNLSAWMDGLIRPLFKRSFFCA